MWEHFELAYLVGEQFPQERVIRLFIDIHQRGQFLNFQRGIQFQIATKDGQSYLGLDSLQETLRLTKERLLCLVRSVIGSCRGGQEFGASKNGKINLKINFLPQSKGRFEFVDVSIAHTGHPFSTTLCQLDRDSLVNSLGLDRQANGQKIE